MYAWIVVLLDIIYIYIYILYIYIYTVYIYIYGTYLEWCLCMQVHINMFWTGQNVLPHKSMLSGARFSCTIPLLSRGIPSGWKVSSPLMVRVLS